MLAQLVTGQQKVPPLSEDPDDHKYVPAAIEGRATFVVTGDPDLTLKTRGVRIVSPRTFLALLEAVGWQRSDRLRVDPKRLRAGSPPRTPARWGAVARPTIVKSAL